MTHPAHTWRFDAANSFYIDLALPDGEDITLQFVGGPGQDPARITTREAGLVAWHLDQSGATVTAQTFAAALRDARSAWADEYEHEADLRRRAADPYPPDPFDGPWWTREDP